MSCISEFSFCKCYFQNLPGESNLFYLKEYLKIKYIGTSIT